MGISEREHHIKVLESLLSHYKAREKCEGYYDSTLKDSIEALQYAISSLKTDLKYDLMYEGEEIYTKADVVAMLTDMKDELKHCEITGLWKANYREGFNDGVSKSLDAIQQKINALKENKDGQENM